MITRWSMAHERLQQELKPRTHYRKEVRPPPPSRSPIPDDWKSGRPLRINGKQYPSISAARKALRTSPRKIYDLIEAGEAKFL